MDKVKGQSHIVGPTTYQLTFLSFHVNQPSKVENLRSRSELKVI